MNQYSLIAFGFVLAVGAACSSSSDGHAPAVEQGGESGSSNSAGAAGRAQGGRSSSDAGAAGSNSSPEGGAAGAVADAGSAGQEPGEIIDVPPSACSEKPKWSGATSLTGISGAGDERLLSITADELDIAFVRDGSLFVAHRGTAAAAFGTPSAVTLPAGYGSDGGASLSADGKKLVLVASTGRALAALSRGSRTEAFGGPADTTAFETLNLRSSQTMERYLSPVLSPDGTSLVFTAYTPEPPGGFADGFEGTSVVYESQLVSGRWDTPINISQDLFDGTTFARPLPSGLSSDSRTLFYFDEASMKELARFRDRPDAPLYTAVELGTRAGAVPNAACNALYYTSAGNVLVDSN